MILILPLRLVSEANTRGHWRDRHARAKEQRALSKMALCGRLHRKPIALPVHVTITRGGPGRLDSDNLVGALGSPGTELEFAL